MMFGKRRLYCITYKTSQSGFYVYRKKYMHNLKVPVNSQSFEGAKILEIASMNVFLLTKMDRVLMFNVDTYKQCGEITIKLLESQTREPNEVIGLALSRCEKYLAIITGKNLVAYRQKQNQLFVFKREKQEDYEYDKWTQIYWVMLKDQDQFKECACMQFFFKETKKEEEDIECLFFTNQQEIFTLNFKTCEIEIIHKWEFKFTSVPLYFTSHPD